jgi:hypothetical protein
VGSTAATLKRFAFAMTSGMGRAGRRATVAGAVAEAGTAAGIGPRLETAVVATGTPTARADMPVSTGRAEHPASVAVRTSVKSISEQRAVRATTDPP